MQNEFNENTEFRIKKCQLVEIDETESTKNKKSTDNVKSSMKKQKKAH